MRPLLILACVMIQAPVVLGQLEPDRLYYGIDRAIPMTVTRPAGAEGDLSIRLMSPEATVIESAGVPEGAVDLAGLFPVLWTSSTPSLMYAQVFTGETKVGSPVVLQPLLTPEYAWLVNMQTAEPTLPGDRAADVRFHTDLAELRTANRKSPMAPHRPVYSGLRTYVDQHVMFETTEGEIEFRLRPDQAPNTVWNFRHLVEGGWYTDIAFHRILPNFVIQGGDPTGIGSGGPGYMFDLERSDLAHDFGVISMARSADPHSNGSQIFVCLSREATAGLDGRYTAFGEAVSGADAIMGIATTPLSDPQRGTPAEPPRVMSARLVDAPPLGEAPIRVQLPAEEPSPR